MAQTTNANATTEAGEGQGDLIDYGKVDLSSCKISVPVWTTVGDGVSEFTAFTVHTEGGGINSTVLRRYSEFLSLHVELKQHALSSELPSFPPKRLFGRFDSNFLDNRRVALETYMQDVLKTTARNTGSLRTFLFVKFLAHPYPCEVCSKHVDPAADETPAMSGYLGKKGNYNSKWRRRYFILQGDHLGYYEVQEQVGLDRPAGVIHLQNSSVSIKSFKGTDEEPHVFLLTTPVRDFKFAASSVESRNRWIQAIVRAKLDDKHQSTRFSQARQSQAEPAPEAQPSQANSPSE